MAILVVDLSDTEPDLLYLKNSTKNPSADVDLYVNDFLFFVFPCHMTFYLHYHFFNIYNANLLLERCSNC